MSSLTYSTFSWTLVPTVIVRSSTMSIGIIDLRKATGRDGQVRLEQAAVKSEELNSKVSVGEFLFHRRFLISSLQRPLHTASQIFTFDAHGLGVSQVGEHG